ncbi:MAG: hypothetical protein DSM106950_37955 [Stigonema ocellatum SAG 48.90 = DSM 106950]|nr:hypothetical protein [Stigonema ocellatum SAG 48.90 = DSM 106950]
MLLWEALPPLKPGGRASQRSHSQAAAQERGRARLLSSQSWYAHDEKFVKCVSPNMKETHFCRFPESLAV